jgi:hypothetical protein
MLDVHPPHSPTHTWKDFFLHIATIVVGLLIAVGLEQTVEYFHHRHQVTETREALLREREENRWRARVNVAILRRTMATLENNRLVLEAVREHPGMAVDALPGAVICKTLGWRIAIDGAWRSAQQTGVVNYMPQTEVQETGRLYTLILLASEQQGVTLHALGAACQDLRSDRDSRHLSPKQLDETLERMQEAETAGLVWRAYANSVHLIDPEFEVAPTEEELVGARPFDAGEKDGLERAVRLSEARIKASGPDPLTVLKPK